jgi:hypothetical protein
VTVDERIERLTERHEALTQALELMQRMWQDQWSKVSTALQQDGENIRALARIAEIHERRLTHLEDDAE